MNKKCEIARDLMPLVIDRAASESAREYVLKHMESCEECKKQYEDMTGELPAFAFPDSEADGFNRSVRQLKRRQKVKRILMTVLALILVPILAWFGLALYLSLTIEPVVEIPADKLNMQVFRLPSGEVQIGIARKDQTKALYSMNWELQTDEESDSFSLHIILREPRLPRKPDNEVRPTAFLLEGRHFVSPTGVETYTGNLFFIDGQIYLTDTVSYSKNLLWHAPRAISRIVYDCEGTENDAVLYESGADVPIISAEEYTKILEASWTSPSLPADFYTSDSHVPALATAYLHGEELPAVPMEQIKDPFDRENTSYLSDLLKAISEAEPVENTDLELSEGQRLVQLPLSIREAPGSSYSEPLYIIVTADRP